MSTDKLTPREAHDLWDEKYPNDMGYIAFGSIDEYGFMVDGIYTPAQLREIADLAERVQSPTT